MGKVGRSNDLGSAFHYLSKDVFGLLINFEVVFFIYTSLPKNATFKRNVSKKKRKKERLDKFSEINELYSFS